MNLSQNEVGYIYSMSEDPNHPETRYHTREKIGKSEKLPQRLGDANNAFTLIQLIVNYAFVIFTPPWQLLLLEQKIHIELDDQRDYQACGDEWFYKTEYSSAKRIQDFLDRNNVTYKFIEPEEAKLITPAPRQPKTKTIQVQPTNHNPYPEQVEAVNLMKSHSRHTFVFPTGFGKTMIMGLFFLTRQGQEKWLILVPTRGLVRQTRNKLAGQGVKTFAYNEQLPKKHPDQFIIISTYHSSKKFKDISFTGIIYDECHRVVLSHKNDKSWFQYVLKHFPNSKHYFFTATEKFIDALDRSAISMDRRDLFGPVYSLTIDDAIEKGYICDYTVRIYSGRNKMNKLTELFSNLLAPYKTIVFCSTTEEADDIQKRLSVQLPNFTVLSYHSKQSGNEQQKNLNLFQTKTNCILSCCNMVAVGFDQPDIDCVIHYNMSDSFILNKQRNGRGSRLHGYKRCTRIYYFIDQLEEVRTVIQLLGDNNHRYVQLENLLPTVVENSSVGGGRFTIEIDLDGKLPDVEITRKLMKIVCSDRSKKEQLKALLHHDNRSGMNLIDRSETIKRYQGIFDENLTNICSGIENFPEFALPKGLYQSYCSTIETDLKKVKQIALALNLTSTDSYKVANHQEHRLPSYTFLLNGGLGVVGNLNDFLHPEEWLDEN